MCTFFLFVIFAIAIMALPVEIYTGNHLSKPGAIDDVLAEGVKAAIAFGLFLWGGGIVAKRGVNYYFKKLEEYETNKTKERLSTMTWTKLPPPHKDDLVESETTID